MSEKYNRKNQIRFVPFCLACSLVGMSGCGSHDMLYPATAPLSQTLSSDHNSNVVLPGADKRAWDGFIAYERTMYKVLPPEAVLVSQFNEGQRAVESVRNVNIFREFKNGAGVKPLDSCVTINGLGSSDTVCSAAPVNPWSWWDSFEMCGGLMPCDGGYSPVPGGGGQGSVIARIPPAPGDVCWTSPAALGYNYPANTSGPSTEITNILAIFDTSGAGPAKDVAGWIYQEGPGGKGAQYFELNSGFHTFWMTIINNLPISQALGNFIAQNTSGIISLSNKDAQTISNRLIHDGKDYGSCFTKPLPA